MNTPNKLTLLRVLMVPLFLVAFIMFDFIPYNFLFALIIFIAASVTDFVDGYLARKNNQVTTFGKFLDPLADKILVISALICFVEFGLASAVAVIIIIAREFAVTSIRLIAASNDGTVIAASNIGKIKTVVQIVAIITPLVLLAFDQIIPFSTFIPFVVPIAIISNVLVILAMIFTAYSGVVYILENKSLINTTK